jgi:hypothetical protein
MRTEVVTMSDLWRAHHVTGRYPAKVREITDRFIGERLRRSEERRVVDNKKSHTVAESDHAWVVGMGGSDELY